jgi:hemerythrin-like domain-containing protein
MNPLYDLKKEHDAMQIILVALKRLSNDIQEKNCIDLFRVGQIIDFLRNYNDHCHHTKEEKYLFVALLDSNYPKIRDIINILIEDHKKSNIYLNETTINLYNYLSGNSLSLENMITSLRKYTSLQENHINFENTFLLPMAEKILDKKLLESMYLNFKRVQDIVIGPIKNMEYYILLTKLYSITKENNSVKNMTESHPNYRVSVL